MLGAWTRAEVGNRVHSVCVCVTEILCRDSCRFTCSSETWHGETSCTFRTSGDIFKLQHDVSTGILTWTRPVAPTPTSPVPPDSSVGVVSVLRDLIWGLGGARAFPLPPSLPLPNRWPLLIFPPFLKFSFQKCSINGILQRVTSWDWLFSCSIIPWRPIRVAA